VPVLREPQPQVLEGPRVLEALQELVGQQVRLPPGLEQVPQELLVC